MLKDLAPVIVIAGGFAVSFIVQKGRTSRYEYRCENCGNVFSLSPLTASVAAHRMGQKWVRCPGCGVRSWAQRDLVRLGDGAGLDGSQSLADTPASLPQELERVGEGALRRGMGQLFKLEGLDPGYRVVASWPASRRVVQWR
jgi:DNA-directed RNA polymerase subunit RPC12/RpoP